ncbi:S-layer homology domain-containing protein, partial [Candidatus Peregrinibacteria bacterium]|nr:S-layer homology domain-containing protein [Candidatus Peregrinibacteria bacterium]
DVPINASRNEKFNDVDDGAWYTKYVYSAKNSDIVKGYSDGSFKPANVVNRAEALKMILEAAGATEYNGTHSFTDVAADAWFEKYVALAVTKGIVKGRSSTSFAPGDPVTRAEIAKMVVETQKTPLARVLDTIRFAIDYKPELYFSLKQKLV